MPGEMPFQFDTGSEWIAASDTLSAAAMEIAFAVCSAERPSNFAAPAATEIDSCSAWLRPRAITGTEPGTFHYLSERLMGLLRADLDFTPGSMTDLGSLAGEKRIGVPISKSFAPTCPKPIHAR